jgi:hypothetical protein
LPLYPESGVKMHGRECFWPVNTGLSLMFLFLPFTSLLVK